MSQGYFSAGRSPTGGRGIRMFKKSLSILACAALALLLAVPAVLMSAPRADAAMLPNWFLAEGSTAWGFGTYINVENPEPVAVTIQITYMTTGGAMVQPPIWMPGLSRLTVNPYSAIGAQDFSTRVVCVGGQTISVDRSMFWMGGPGRSRRRRWRLPPLSGLQHPPTSGGFRRARAPGGSRTGRAYRTPMELSPPAS